MNHCVYRIIVVLPVLLVCVLSPIKMNAQTGKMNNEQLLIQGLDSMYGSDPFLINGVKKLDSYGKFSGDQYLNSPNFFSTKIFVHGATYYSAMINFDIISDRVVLSYKNRFGADEMIFLNSWDVDSFYVENKLFYLLPDRKEDGFFCKRKTLGNSAFVSKYTKDIKMNTTSGGSDYYITDKSESLYYYNGNTLLHIKGWHSFKSCFTKEDFVKFKKLRDRKQKFKSISDDQLGKLLADIKSIENN